MPTPFEDFFKNVPPVTRTYMTVCFLTTLVVHLELISPFSLYFNWDLISHDLQLWRLLTTFLFYGYFGLNFIFHMFFLVRHSWELEDSFYHGRSAEYLVMWIFNATCLLLLNGIFMHYGASIMFLAPSLAFSIVYVWSRRNPSLVLNFLGLFTFTAPYLPWVILAFGYLLNQSPLHDLLGIGVGHIYYYLDDVYPKLRPGRRIFFAPTFLKRLMGEA